MGEGILTKEGSVNRTNGKGSIMGDEKSEILTPTTDEGISNRRGGN